MNVILVGSREERARLRASLNGAIRVVGEFLSLTEAEAARLEVDGILVSPRVRQRPSRGKRASASLAGSVRFRRTDETALADRVAERPDDGGGGPDTTYDSPYAERDGEALQEPLTPREIQVLELLAEGLPNKRIAERLGISDQTAKFHVASISGKLGAANRTDAVRRAVRRGLITL
jgi:DNA-binding NarL/FixJ family response regulator